MSGSTAGGSCSPRVVQVGVGVIRGKQAAKANVPPRQQLGKFLSGFQGCDPPASMTVRWQKRSEETAPTSSPPQLCCWCERFVRALGGRRERLCLRARDLRSASGHPGAGGASARTEGSWCLCCFSSLGGVAESVLPSTFLPSSFTTESLRNCRQKAQLQVMSAV
eukprot:760332-Hanusia_phi.AAC.2